MTYYCRRNDRDDRLECEVAFNRVEMTLFANGPEAYLLAICQEPERDLEKAGAIRPFQYSCAKVGVGEVYMLTVGEL